MRRETSNIIRETKASQMDIKSAVFFSEVQISHKVGAFFVTTEFGRVGIEVNPTKMIDPNHPVDVRYWSDAPSTKWTRSITDETADYYVGLNIFGTLMSDHLAIVEAFTRCMFIHLGYYNVSDDVIDAAVFTFVDNYSSFSVTVNTLEREYIKNHLKGTTRHSYVVKAMVRDQLRRKIDRINEIFAAAQMALERRIKEDPEIAETIFFDSYSREVFGIIVYAYEEIMNTSARSYRKLMTYSEDTTKRGNYRKLNSTVPKVPAETSQK